MMAADLVALVAALAFVIGAYSGALGVIFFIVATLLFLLLNSSWGIL